MFVALFVVVVVVARASVRPCVVVCRHSSQMDRHIHSLIHTATPRPSVSVAPRSTDRPPASCVTFFNGSRLVRRARASPRSESESDRPFDAMRSILPFSSDTKRRLFAPFFCLFPPRRADRVFFVVDHPHPEVSTPRGLFEKKVIKSVSRT